MVIPNKMEQQGTVGIHVDRIEKRGLESSIRAAAENLPGTGCMQIFTHGPRSKSLNKFNMDDMRDLCQQYRIYVHSTYFTTWKDIEHMRQQFSMASALGAQGVVLHLTKMPPEDHIDVLNRVRVGNINGTNIPCKIILEMKALKPDRWTYQTPREINELCKALTAAGYGPDRVVICLDTAHIAAGRISLRTREDAEKYLAEFAQPDYIGLLHLNGNSYNSAERAGDHHCVPMCGDDWIWHKSSGDAEPPPLAESGVRVLVDWFTSRGRDVILEQDFSDELVAFYRQLTA